MANKLTDQELQEVQDIRKSIAEIASVLGDLNYQKISLEIMIEEQKLKVLEVKKREMEFFQKVRTSYGNVSINIDTGEIS